MSIKKINKDQFVLLTQFIHQLLEEDFAGVYKKESIEAYKRYYSEKYFKETLKSKRNIGIGAFEKNILIGVALLKCEFGGVGHFEWLGVKKERRNKGIATALIKTTEEIANKHKLHYLYLFTEKQTNIDFYKKRGFSYIGLHKNSWFGENEYLMSKYLRDKPHKEAFVI